MESSPPLDLEVPVRVLCYKPPCPRFACDCISAEVAALRADKERLEAASAWQDIANAPKDGRSVLCYGADWDNASFQWYGEARGVTAWHPEGELETFADAQPTHWLGLPPFPALQLRRRDADALKGKGL